MDFSNFIERWAAQRPGAPAVVFDGATITYAALWQRVEAATARLAALGVRHGDRVAWLGGNHPELLAVLFALARIGAILAPLNFRLAVPELREVLEHAEVSHLIVDPEYQAAGDALAQALPLVKRISLADAARAPKGWFVWYGEPTAGFTPRLEGELGDPLLIVYTSGTTGRPKGAVHTQEAMIWNIVASQATHDFTPADRVLMALPMFHVGGLCIQTLPALHAGASVIVHPRFDPGRWLADVAAAKPTVSLLVPATARAVVEHPAWAATDLGSLRLMNMGSSVVPTALIRAFIDRGVTVVQVYGATETGPVSIVLRPEDSRSKVGSTGKPALYNEVRLVGPDGNDVAPGTVGEIWLRAKNMMAGYWRDPDNPSYRDGWFRTGDLASVDVDGFYWVAGRTKDMIISGGENVYPAEIENILTESSDVVECAVVGRPDPKWGEVAVAVIVRKPGSALDEAAVRAMFEGRIARYKHPRRVVFMEALPKTALGKVQKADVARALDAGAA